MPPDNVLPKQESARLLTGSRFPVPDDAYRAIVEAQRGLSNTQCLAMNAQLVLLLANHIGEMHVLREALALARENVTSPGDPLALPREAR